MQEVGVAAFAQEILVRRGVDQGDLQIAGRRRDLVDHVRREVDDDEALPGGGHLLHFGNEAGDIGRLLLVETSP